MNWLFMQELEEIIPYDLYQVCWAAIAYIRYQSIKDGNLLNSSNSSFKGRTILIKISLVVWLVFITGTIWKFAIDVLLPSHVPAFEKFIGKLGSRTWYQRLVWLILLQFVQIFVEVFALCNYVLLAKAMKLQFEKVETVQNMTFSTSKSELKCGLKWKERMVRRRLARLQMATAVRSYKMFHVL